ncbi:MAG: hypothetical protein KGQ28_12180 [Hyphomicrobiales bacterium]|nr:hypothetical protein [Hyphomicrobiales bacterium]
MSATVDVRRGAVYLPRALVDAHFAAVDAVVVLVRDGRLLILPVSHAGAGGCLLKLRNSAGDRVAVAADVFAAHGLADLDLRDAPAVWAPELAALCIALPDTDAAN